MTTKEITWNLHISGDFNKHSNLVRDQEVDTKTLFGSPLDSNDPKTASYLKVVDVC